MELTPEKVELWDTKKIFRWQKVIQGGSTTFIGNPIPQFLILFSEDVLKRKKKLFTAANCKLKRSYQNLVNTA